MLREVERATWQAALQRDRSVKPDARRARGIVHTPPEIARGVVALVDRLVIDQFGFARGLCDERVHVIDPACGPGAFLAAALAQAEQRGADQRLRLSGFDIDQETLDRAHALASHPCTGSLTLERADMLDGEALWSLAENSDRVLALIGNPPWTIARSQPSAAAQRLLEDFRRDERGARLVERKLGVIADAYVRFFRVCAEAARRARAGAVIGLVTNGSFLDGPIHRGMRAALLRWFDSVQVLDLGGSALLGRAPGRDDNVFGVRPSVAITWLCRRPGSPKTPLRYARMVGDKLDKLARVAAADGGGLMFRSLSPEAPFFRFVPTRRARPEYARYVALDEALPFQREGVQSNRDAIVIDRDRDRLLARLRAFMAADGGGGPELERALASLAHYDPKLARRRLAEAFEADPEGVNVTRPIAYRPLDDRYYCPIAPLCHRPRRELQRACEQSTLVLASVRKDRGSLRWSHVAASSLILDNCFLSARSSCRARAFPNRGPDGADNLAPALADTISNLVGRAIDAVGFQHYALAILSAVSYRARFDDELRQEYPRIPLPPSAAG
ncbi:MAG TPA: type ISP restriction/modification enzyme, partial [Polyangiales bacterium]